jgi:hypothetical protein
LLLPLSSNIIHLLGKCWVSQDFRISLGGFFGKKRCKLCISDERKHEKTQLTKQHLEKFGLGILIIGAYWCFDLKN